MDILLTINLFRYTHIGNETNPDFRTNLLCLCKLEQMHEIVVVKYLILAEQMRKKETAFPFSPREDRVKNVA